MKILKTIYLLFFIYLCSCDSTYNNAEQNNLILEREAVYCLVLFFEKHNNDIYGKDDKYIFDKINNFLVEIKAPDSIKDAINDSWEITIVSDEKIIIRGKASSVFDGDYIISENRKIKIKFHDLIKVKNI